MNGYASMLPKEVDFLFRHLSPSAYAVMIYCASCTAYRILKIGWEKEINFLNSRRLILTAMYLPLHSRPALMDHALAKAIEEGDTECEMLLRKQAEAFQRCKEQAMKASA